MSFLIEEVLPKVSLYEIGNIIEYNRGHVSQYGKISEITGRFRSSLKDKFFEIYYRVDADLVTYSQIIRRISEH